MSLKFEYRKLMDKYIDTFYKELEVALKEWEDEVRGRILSDFIKKHGNPEVDSYVETTKNGLIGYLRANPAVLADSFGTGSLMDVENNPVFQEYWNNPGKEQWQRNPARKTHAIEGRPKGPYTTIFGKQMKSSGKRAGDNLEDLEKSYIKPIPPSNAITDANTFLFNTYLPKAFERTLDSIDFSNYIIEVK